MQKTSLKLAIFLTLCLIHITAQAQSNRIIIDGVSADLAKKIQTTLSIEQVREQTGLSNRRVRRLHDKAKAEIEQALQAVGYYRPAIQAELNFLNKAWTAKYHIYPGPELKLTNVDILINGDGSSNPQLKQLLEDSSLRQGSTLDHKSYEDLKNSLLKRALDLGYLDAHLSRHQIRIDLDAYTATIALHLETGARYYFGHITINQDALKPRLARRFARVKKGDPYTKANLLILQNGFRDSDYYSDIDLQARRDQVSVNNEIPVTVNLTAHKPTKYTIGLGYGTDTGWRGSVGWEKRRANQRGHRVGALLKLSELRNSISGRYRVPIRNPRTDSYAMTASYVEERTDTSESQTTLLSASRSIARGLWLEALSLNYQWESFIVAEQEDIARLFYPGINYTWVNADNRLYTTRGSRISLDLRGASESFSSDVNFIQSRAQLKLIYPLWSGSRVIGRADVGYTNVSDFLDLPATVRFFAGGDQSVRGYAYNSLGPENDAGEVIGGKHLLVGTLEIEQKLADKWAIAVFYDKGNALNDFSDPLKEGTGLGIRWRSPIGQIRLDAAVALSDPDKPWRIHFNIGPDL